MKQEAVRRPVDFEWVEAAGSRRGSRFYYSGPSGEPGSDGEQNKSHETDAGSSHSCCFVLDPEGVWCCSC
ncbi:Uncharacterized protein DAT39_016096, partial [Clarias magur]